MHALRTHTHTQPALPNHAVSRPFSHLPTILEKYSVIQYLLVCFITFVPMPSQEGGRNVSVQRTNALHATNVLAGINCRNFVNYDDTFVPRWSMWF